MCVFKILQHLKSSKVLPESRSVKLMRCYASIQSVNGGVLDNVFLCYCELSPQACIPPYPSLLQVVRQVRALLHQTAVQSIEWHKLLPLRGVFKKLHHQACLYLDPKGRIGSQELVDTVEELGGIWLVTADHGNVEEMVQRDKKGNPLMEDGQPVMLTSHTLNPIPVAIGGPGLPKTVKFRQDLKEKGIASIGSTIVNLLGFSLPDSKYNFEPTLITTD